VFLVPELFFGTIFFNRKFVFPLLHNLHLIIRIPAFLAPVAKLVLSYFLLLKQKICSIQERERFKRSCSTPIEPRPSVTHIHRTAFVAVQVLMM
jgi:hypothetical protein